jgi:hypothetical protein
MGFIIDELTSAPIVPNAVEKLKMRVPLVEVRRIITMIRGICLKILRFPNNADYWRLRADSAAFNLKLGRFDGATDLLEAVGFIETNKIYYEIRGARTADGKRSSGLSKSCLNILREKCSELDAELSLLDGVESVGSILQRVAVENRRLSLGDYKSILESLMLYVMNVLKNPKDSRCWRIREANKLFQRQIGHLKSATDLMNSIGFELISTSQGGVYILRGTGMFEAKEKSKRSADEESGNQTADLSTFAFSRVSEQMEWFLWRRKQELERLLEDDLEYLHEILAQAEEIIDTVMTTESTQPTNQRADGNATSKKKGAQHKEEISKPTSKAAAGNTKNKIYPYGKNTLGVFAKTSAQKMQVDMIRKLFAKYDVSQRGYLTVEDISRQLPVLERVNNKHLINSSSEWEIALTEWMEALDPDGNGRITLDDFGAAFGPLIDHSFDTKQEEKPTLELKAKEKLSLFEQVSLLVGKIRLQANMVESIQSASYLLQLMSKIIKEPSNSGLWKLKIASGSDADRKLLRFSGAQELLLLMGFRTLENKDNPSVAPKTVKVTTNGVNSSAVAVDAKTLKEFELRPQKLKFKTTRNAPLPEQTLDGITLEHLSMIRVILEGHVRGMKLPELSDIGAVARAIGYLPATLVSPWVNLLELVLVYMKNIVEHPGEERYRQLNTSNSTYMVRVRNTHGGRELLHALGFRDSETGALVLPNDVTEGQLLARKLEIEAGLCILQYRRATKHKVDAEYSANLQLKQKEDEENSKVDDEEFVIIKKPNESEDDFLKRKAIADVLLRQSARGEQQEDINGSRKQLAKSKSGASRSKATLAIKHTSTGAKISARKHTTLNDVINDLNGDESSDEDDGPSAKTRHAAPPNAVAKLASRPQRSNTRIATEKSSPSIRKVGQQRKPSVPSSETV